MQKRDYYEILGISKNATKQQIKSAYRKLAKQFHPDRNKASDAETKFKEIQEAYEILSDDQKRSAYDKYGHAATQGFGGAATQGYSGVNGFDFSDFGNLNDIFEQFFGGGFGGFSSSSATRRPSKGQDIELDLKLSFDEAIFGTEKELHYRQRSICQSCKGTGAKNGTSIKTCHTCNGQGRVTQVQRTFIGNIQTVTVCPTCGGSGKEITVKCPVCEGSGIKLENASFTVRIPQGIPDGVTLRFKEKGHTGEKGGENGELYINIEVTPHEKLERRGDDIYTDAEISAIEAVLGHAIKVPTVRGSEELRIPAGTQPGDVIKMSGVGGPKFKGNGNGDEYVRILVRVPKKLTKEQKQLWQKLLDIQDQQPGFMDRIFN